MVRWWRNEYVAHAVFCNKPLLCDEQRPRNALTNEHYSYLYRSISKKFEHPLELWAMEDTITRRVQKPIWRTHPD